MTNAQVLQKMFVEYSIDSIPAKTNKKVLYVMNGDGIWQIRKNNIGTFYIHQAKTKIPGLSSKIKEGWELNVPLIPSSLLQKTLSFFRAIYEKYGTEAHIQFYYDFNTEEYILNCPKQKVTSSSVSYEYDKDFAKKTLVLEIHSHGSMGAFFSGTDNNDEKDDRFFGVVGNIDKYYPDIKLRLSVGGQKIDVNLDDIFDLESNTVEFPEDWIDRVKKREIKVNKRKNKNTLTESDLFDFDMGEDENDFYLEELRRYNSNDYLFSDYHIPKKYDIIE